MQISISATPVFYIPLTVEQVRLVSKIGSNHYDSVCANACRVGGFIYGWINQLSFSSGSDPTVKATWRELDTVLKICEMGLILPPNEKAMLRDLVADFHSIMKQTNEITSEWHSVIDTRPALVSASPCAATN